MPEVAVSAQELTMALALIDLLRAPFDPAGYRDAYREALTAIIEAKLREQDVVRRRPCPASAVDLMAALKASVAAGGTAKRRLPDRRNAVGRRQYEGKRARPEGRR